MASLGIVVILFLTAENAMLNRRERRVSLASWCFFLSVPSVFLAILFLTAE
jgi:hypothetical protein